MIFFFCCSNEKMNVNENPFFVHFFMKIEWEKNLKQNEEWNDIKKGLSGNGNHHQSQNFHTHTHLTFMYRFNLLIFQPVRYVNCFKNVATTPFFTIILNVLKMTGKKNPWQIACKHTHIEHPYQCHFVVHTHTVIVIATNGC